ncbi:hypothetical protein JCM31447_09520 [Fluviispira sanaruensis]|uniref:Uncharacterized protein n=2 Tax=Fluviispira sanaruensis TaxID=2493639 RepID=A0A4P2VID3_FLUSA|nr:hypothetical protein JCM31447_09520 [Fluviispira sanaruensis]
MKEIEMNFFNKYTFVLGVLIVLIILFMGKIFFSEEKKSGINISQTELNKINSNNNKIESTNKENEINENIDVEAKNNEFKDFVNIIFPISVKEVQQEVEFLEKKLRDENAVERLNSNSVSTEERQNYQQIYKRLSLLSKYIMEKDYADLSIKVSEYEKEHKKNLEELGIKREIN